MSKDAQTSSSLSIATLAMLVMLCTASLTFAQQPAVPDQPLSNVPAAIDEPSRATPAILPMTASPLVAPATPMVAPATTGGFPQLGLPNFGDRETFSSALQIVVLLTVLSLAPSIMVMMTSFTRIIIVMSLLRQALGTPTLPPNQVLIGLSLFMTFVVMGPTFSRVHDDALRPYLDGSMSQADALAAAEVPIRDFMIRQIVEHDNDQEVLMFHEMSGADLTQEVKWQDISTLTIVPGFMLSELKVAFLMGFKIYLPFLIIDMVISSVLISMGMMMLPPVLISLPFKLLLFVLVDGWLLITHSLMMSFAGT